MFRPGFSDPLSSINTADMRMSALAELDSQVPNQTA